MRRTSNAHNLHTKNNGQQNRTALQSAVNEVVGTGGGTLFIPIGSYRIATVFASPKSLPTKRHRSESAALKAKKAGRAANREPRRNERARQKGSFP